ncbi:MAG: hypothetical protein IPG58_17090 [Acidobacteria bacterium]|nr:hypothetical protein [Acidobacteriota bacterium]
MVRAGVAGMTLTDDLVDGPRAKVFEGLNAHNDPGLCYRRPIAWGGTEEHTAVPGS